MPLTLSPDKRRRIVLASDASSSNGQAPAFIYRHLSGREWLQIAEAQESLGALAGQSGTGQAARAVELLFSSARIGLVGWENLIDPETGERIAFAADLLDDIISVTEAQELIAQILDDGPDAEEKKSCDLPSPSTSATSAAGADLVDEPAAPA